MDRIASFAACCALALCAACGGSNTSDENPRASRTGDSGIAARASTPQDFVHATSYVGMRYASLPAGFAYRAGSVIQPGSSSGRYTLSQVETPHGDMIWLEAIERRERVVYAELRTPPLAADERLLIGSCDLSGKLDPRIVAIVVADSGAVRFTKVRQAWRANAGMGQFDMLPVSGIVCEEPGG